jgi:hypothetical protein
MNHLPDYWIARFVFQKGVALTYLIAFLAAVNQFLPLLGERGLLPAPAFARLVSFRQSPSLFLWMPKDRAFRTAAWAGVALSIVALTGVAEYHFWSSALVWAALWVLYLSFVNVGQIFYGFGWESLLLETGFFTIFSGTVDTAPPLAVIWIWRWILFRDMFGAGLIKLRADPCWKNLRCLDYYFETQPMPNPLSWYFHWFPEWLHKGGVLFNHFAELAAPMFYFAPQPLATAAGLLTIAFQGTLMLSGNLSWLNLITIVLAISTLDDRFLGHFIPVHAPPLYDPAIAQQILTWIVVVIVLWLSVRPISNMLSSRQLMNYSYNPLHLVNTYGAFGGITRLRFEIVVEGADGEIEPTTEWKEYEFKGKPGGTRRTPPQIAPYHLRLDWLMWFAAMRPNDIPVWFVNFVAKLLEGDSATLSLLKTNPFPQGPPQYIRAMLYEYRFTTPEERRETGEWWSRTLAGTYLPASSLRVERPVHAISGSRPHPE